MIVEFMAEWTIRSSILIVCGALRLSVAPLMQPLMLAVAPTLIRKRRSIEDTAEAVF